MCDISGSPTQISRIEIEINTHCNRNCSYCPSKKLHIGEYYMQERHYKEIIQKVCDIGFSGRISYHFYSEPLLHPNLEFFTKYAKEKLPYCQNVIYTNGDLLTDEKYNMLLYSGVDHIFVSNHENRLIASRAKQTVLNICDLTLTNRGGNLFPAKETLRRPCFAPSRRLMIAYNGNIILCYEDAAREQILGNIIKSSIISVWLSDKYKYIRKQLENNNRADIVPCKFCDNSCHDSFEKVSLNII